MQIYMRTREYSTVVLDKNDLVADCLELSPSSLNRQITYFVLFCMRKILKVPISWGSCED